MPQAGYLAGIAYPPEFVQAVKALLPDDRKVHQELDEGGLGVGHYLEEAMRLNSGGFSESQRRECRQLHEEWVELYSIQCEDDG